MEIIKVAKTMQNKLFGKPPWPNGQGVGLLIRRLRVRVPQGVLSVFGEFPIDAFHVFDHLRTPP